MENEVIKTGLVDLLEEKNISEQTALSIAPSFEDFYTQTVIWKHKVMEFLEDPNVSKEEKAKQARLARLSLIKVRTGIDKKRKEINDEANKKIKEVNGIASVLTDFVTPLEDLLLETEKAQEIAQKAINDKIKSDREALLEPFGVDSTFYDLINMPDNLFDQLLETTKLAHDAKIQKEKEAEKESAFNQKITQRISSLALLGFILDEDPNPIEEGKQHYYNEDIGVGIIISIKEASDEYFNAQVLHCKEEIEAYKQKLKIEAAEKEAAILKAEKEAAILKAEKEELERTEKERKEKHEVAINRQKLLNDIGVICEFDLMLALNNEEFNRLYDGHKKEYDEKKNAEYVAKKKAEFEANKLKKEAEEKAEKERQAKLAPDKEKIQISVDQCILHKLELSTGATEALYATIQSKFDGFKKWANEQVNTLK